MTTSYIISKNHYKSHQNITSKNGYSKQIKMISFFFSYIEKSGVYILLFTHKLEEASLGMRQSPLGDKLTEPTLGPSGMQLRLNC